MARFQSFKVRLLETELETLSLETLKPFPATFKEIPIRTYNLCFVGYGNVNRTLVRLLEDRAEELRTRHGIAYRITGIASRSLGWIADPNGVDPTETCGRGPALSEVEGAPAREKPAANPNRSASQITRDVRDWLAAAQSRRPLRSHIA